MMIVWSGSLMNIFIGLMGWLILPNGFYQGMWAALQIGFGIINLMPFSPDGEKLFAYYQAKEQKYDQNILFFLSARLPRLSLPAFHFSRLLLSGTVSLAILLKSAGAGGGRQYYRLPKAMKDSRPASEAEQF